MLGRIAEASAVARLLRDTASGRGGALFVGGEPGLGRTTLLRRILTLDDTVRAVYLAGTAAESGLRYAGLHQVVQACRCDLPRLPAPQRDLLGHLLATGQQRPGDTGLAVGAATLGLLGAAAARRPLLLAIDDAHLLDTPSREALLVVARRIAEEPIVLLLTAEHRGSAAGSAAGFALRPAVTGVPELRLGPLDPADARTLLQHSARHPLRRFVADRLLAVAEGNPLALTELPAVLTPGQCSGHLPLDDPLAPGERLRDTHLPTLARLPDPARAALLVPAAAGDVPSGDLQRALELLGHAPDALLPAEEEGVVDGRLRALGSSATSYRKSSRPSAPWPPPPAARRVRRAAPGRGRRIRGPPRSERAPGCRTHRRSHRHCPPRPPPASARGFVHRPGRSPARLGRRNPRFFREIPGSLPRRSGAGGGTARPGRPVRGSGGPVVLGDEQAREQAFEGGPLGVAE
ncbi:AAA family ATPase [Streptomyces sp. NPDC096311]|uniref:AAA family ATPase n=1 Tax=Streptomyces sp. NPDC096311 TaxID=3366083 RepID=UPI0038034AC9